MCGIAAIVRTDGNPASGKILQGMLNMIAYRGPDEAGFALLNNESIAFGQVRLSIIDVASGLQPMWDTQGEVCLIFNGEIYDHAVLRRSLQEEGQRFNTRTDTEVILGLYKKHGLDMFAHLNGEFAFLLWDVRRRRLVAARDRHGIKPLFFHQRYGSMYFCSESKGILSVPGVERAIDPKYLTGAMFGAWPNNTSVFAGINALPPGHCLILDEGKSPRQQRYWAQTYAPDKKMSFDDAKQGVRYYLQRAVKRRLVADVPVCMYLSGGVDSSLVAAMATGQGQKLKCFTLGFSNSVYDETERARKTAKFLGAPFEPVPCSNDDIAANFERCLFHTETCVGNSGAVGKMLLSQHVRRAGFKVALTGEGADELFAGYPYFKLELIRKMMLGRPRERLQARSLWKKFLKVEHRSEGTLWTRGSAWRSMPMLYGYPSVLQSRTIDTSRLALSVLHPDITARAQLPEAQFIENFPPDLFHNMHPTHASLKMTLNWLSGYILINLGDRMEMANSIEGRPPFLDHELASFAGTIPPEYLTHLPTLREKYVLYEAYADDIPAEVRRNHKHPFLSQNWRTLAQTGYGAQLFQRYFSRKTIESAGIFNYDSVNRLKMLGFLTPSNMALNKQLDTLVGIVLSGQVLHEAFVNQCPSAARIINIRRIASPVPRIGAA